MHHDGDSKDEMIDINDNEARLVGQPGDQEPDMGGHDSAG